MKKITAIIATLSILFLLVSCNNSNKTTPEVSVQSSHSENVVYTENNNVSEATTEESVSEALLNVSETAPELTETTSIVDPSNWTKEEIIDFYKKAAEKSNSTAKSTQVMVLQELVVNEGNGAIGFLLKLLKPAIASVLKKNSMEFDGITGGFGALEVSDAQSIKAYKSGEYTIVEMTMKPQTDGIYADAYSGSVGHAITVLGNVSRAIEQFPQFDVDLEKADIIVRYINPTVKVKINKNGIIEKGAWKYTCDVDIKNLSINGIMIDVADAKIDYDITVGGGF